MEDRIASLSDGRQIMKLNIELRIEKGSYVAIISVLCVFYVLPIVILIGTGLQKYFGS